MENRTFWIVVGILVLGLGFVLLQPTIEEELAPTLDQAWVAIEAEGSGVAVIGPVELEEGAPFTLHAVVQGTTRGGEPVYYTEAPAVELDGERLPADQLRRWNRPKPIKVRWYSIEGRWPYLPLGDEGIGPFRYESFLRSDWPLAWSVPGDVDPANDDHLSTDGAPPRPKLGTLRFRAQLELYAMEDDLMPAQIVRSWDVDDLKREVERFPTVTLLSGDGAREASRFFGLTQLDPQGEVSPDLLRQIDELTRHRIAFSRSTLLRAVAEAAGTKFSELTWESVDLTGGLVWGTDAAPGDLLRVGDRVVVLYRDVEGDAETAGRVDYGDWCFDFVQGLEARALADVFSGEGRDLEIARLHSSVDPES